MPKGCGASLGWTDPCSLVLTEHTTDLAFPRSALLASSCQYTMVPLGGLPGHTADHQPYSSSQARRVHVSRGCPAGPKPQQHCPDELQQVTGSWGGSRGDPHLPHRATVGCAEPLALCPDLLVTLTFEQHSDVNSLLSQNLLASGYDPQCHQVTR